MIRQYDVIKHKTAMDTAVQVLYVTVHAETGNTIIDGAWLNQGQVKTFAMNYPAQFFIRPEHMQNWLRCKNPKSDFIRNEQWEPIT